MRVVGVDELDVERRLGQRQHHRHLQPCVSAGYRLVVGRVVGDVQLAAVSTAQLRQYQAARRRETTRAPLAQIHDRGAWTYRSRESVLFTTDGESPYDAVHHPDFEEDGWFGTEFPI